MKLRRAETRDLPQIETLLKRADQPALPPHPVLANVIVAQGDAGLIGVVTLEVSGRSGLVRSIAVDAAERGRGVGRELMRSLTARAHELSLNQVYAVASDAEGFFQAVGFEPAPLEGLPSFVRERRTRAGGAPLVELRLR